MFGDNDTGIKQNGDGILDTFANSQHTVRVAPGEMQVLGSIRAGNAKRMTMTSSNNSVLNAQFNLWGDGNRPTVIELDDDQDGIYTASVIPMAVFSLLLMDKLFRIITVISTPVI